jgi:hypothetical protein
MRKSTIVLGSVAVAAIGSTALGGMALAGGHHHCCEYKHSHSKGKSYSDNDYARGGDGGKATNNCVNIGVPILSGIGVGGEGKAGGAGCTANANGGDATAY